MSGPIRFDGQVAVVTGAGRGLGRLYALELAARGASVVVNDPGGTVRGEGGDTAVADRVVAEIEAGGGRAVASHDSVATRQGAEAIVATAVDRFGRLDVLISNAGIFHTAPFDEIDEADWDRMLRTHLTGAFHVSQAAFRVMRQQRYGRIVYAASSAGLFGQPNSAHYAAAKAGTLGLANVVALEGAEHGILANCVLPFGYTRMVFETVGRREDLESEPGFLHAIEPELVVPLVAYLASRECGLSHHAFSACAGRFARVFVGLAEGWLADPHHAPTAEDVAANLAAIVATEPYTVPTSIFDEVARVCARLGI